MYLQGLAFRGDLVDLKFRQCGTIFMMQKQGCDGPGREEMLHAIQAIQAIQAIRARRWHRNSMVVIVVSDIRTKHSDGDAISLRRQGEEGVVIFHPSRFSCKAYRSES